ncbi:uncharacterized protein [Littorina saxatilis]|uniref:uncharacterized protein n=1 Tax=Littorina saxatilis TaxID=31220 RepID=UPI0038B4C61B
MTTFFSFIITAEPSSDPVITNCNHFTSIEGGNSPATPCECRVTSLGSPSGRLQWVADDVVLVSGEYGVTQLVFPYDKLTRTHNGMDMRCQVDWVVRKNSVNFTAQLFYGPDRVDIFLLTSLSHNVNDDVTLLCEPFDVNPPSHIVITWGGLCQSQQGRTCTLTPPIAEHCGKEVTCTAANQRIPGKQAISRLTVELDSCTAQTVNNAGRLWEGVGIGAGVVVLVVVVMVVIMVWRRRLLLDCRCCYQTYDSPSKKRQKEEEEQHTYTDLSPYDSIVDVPGSSSGANQVTTSRTASSLHNEPGNQPTNQNLPTTPSHQGLDGNQSDANHNNAANRSANYNLSRHAEEEVSQTKEDAQAGEIYTHDYLELVPDSPPQKPVE